jgi:hypothetical protein
MPEDICEGVFLKLFQECEIARYQTRAIMEYEQSWKENNDWYAVLSTAEKKGIEKGRICQMRKGFESTPLPN